MSPHRERSEVATEADSFERFRDAVLATTPTVDRGLSPARRTLHDQSPGETAEKLRNAYRSTVMSVAHYDEAYGETLTEDLASEIGPELATVLEPGSNLSFTPTHKQALLEGIDTPIAQREGYLEVLTTEQESIESAREDVSALMRDLDYVLAEQGNHDDFEDRLSEISETRQEVIRSHSLQSSLDGCSLCEYLYSREEWSYPVLTAIARLQDAMVFEE